MTTGIPAPPARAVGVGLGSGSAGSPRAAVRRPLLLLALAAVVVAALGFLPAPLGLAGPLVAYLVIIAVGVLLARGARHSAHPAAWRWFAVAVPVSGIGSALGSLVLTDGHAALGSIPGVLLMSVAMVRLIDPEAVAAARAKAASSVALFLVADLLTVHTALHMTIGVQRGGSVGEVGAVSALMLAMALGNCAALLHFTVSSPGARRAPALVLTGQWSTGVAASMSALLDGPLPFTTLVCGISVFGLGALVLACRADVPVPPRVPGPPAPAGSPAGDLLPHLVAMFAGTILLVSSPVTGGLTITGTVLGVLGLAAFVLNQLVALRGQQRLTVDLQRSEAYFRTLVRGSVDPVVILDEGLTVRWASPAVTDLLGFDPARMVGLTITDVLHSDDVAGLVRGLGSGAAPGDQDTKTRTARVRHVDGRWLLIQARVRDLRNDPDVGALVLYCRDVTVTTPSPVADADLAAFGTVDPATGLPNRSALTLRLSAALRAPAAWSTSLVVLGIDGLPDTDAAEVLRELTARISRVLRGDDWLARVAVSEFAVLVNGSVSDAEAVATRLVGAVQPVGAQCMAGGV